MQPSAADLIATSPDALLGVTVAAAKALHRETGTIPIVFTQVSDPIGSGLMENLARPGGNITGFTNFEALHRNEIRLIRSPRRRGRA
jgi:putative ABC transport system substrate-binding protein